MELVSVPVTIGAMEYSNRQDSVLVTYSLGSCIGLTLYDPRIHLGAMAHIMLPAGPAQPGDEGKYAVTCVPALVEGMIRRGADKRRITAKIAGGAGILSLNGGMNGTRIGQQNQLATTQALGQLGLRVAATDCGGNFGRTMRLYLDSGRVEISTAVRGQWTI